MRKYGTRPDVERYAVRYSATSQTTTCILLRCIHAEGLHFSAFHLQVSIPCELLPRPPHAKLTDNFMPVGRRSNGFAHAQFVRL